MTDNHVTHHSLCPCPANAPKRRAWEAWVARGHIGPDGIVQSAWLHGYDAGAAEGVRAFVEAVLEQHRQDMPEWIREIHQAEWEADTPSGVSRFEQIVIAAFRGLGRRGAEGEIG